jgi:hypothetical protein
VSKQPQRTPAPEKESIKELAELEDASAALREQFLGRFRKIHADSAAHFHKEMTYWPNTKRLMRIDRRDRFRIARNDADNIRWMRAVFARSLDALSAELAQPRQMEKFLDVLRLMRSDIEWVEREASKIGPLLRKECLLWAQVCCDGQAASRDWCAPGWLDNFPADLPPKALLSAARVKRLDGDCTARVLKEIANQIKKRLAPVQESALNNLRVRLFLEKENARQTANVADAKAAAGAKGKSREAIEDIPENAGMDQAASRSAISASVSRNSADRRAAINAFILNVTKSGRRITRKDIWTVAGYHDPTEFERFQRGDSRTTKSATTAFDRVLGMKPEAFIQSANNKTTPQ